jgi:hypothetical protein
MGVRFWICCPDSDGIFDILVGRRATRMSKNSPNKRRSDAYPNSNLDRFAPLPSPRAITPLVRPRFEGLLCFKVTEQRLDVLFAIEGREAIFESIAC